MRRPLLHRVGLAPRIAVLVVLAMLVTHALQEVLEVLVPPPDFLVVEKEWLVQRTVDAAVAVGRARGEARAGALSALGADDALAFRIGGAPPPGTIQDVPVLRDAAAEIARRLALAPAHVVVRAEPFSEPEIAVGTPIVVLTRLPTWIRDVVNERIQEDAAITGSLVIAVRLDDGRWLSVTAKKTELARVRQLRIVAATGGGLLLIALLSIFAARLLIRPLGQLAKAAERLGRERELSRTDDMNIPEYAAIARAFDDMQVRIKRFVDERTRLLGAISHDLRTPLTRIRLLAEFVEDPHQRAQLLSDVAEMDAMIRSSLDFAGDRLRTEDYVLVDVASLLISLCDACSDAGGDATYAGPDHSLLRCQPVALRRAFANLVDNACKYGLRARVVLEDAPGRVVVRVEDDGPGIAPSDVERAFAPFEQLDNRAADVPGVGLGLSIARDVVHGHGGEIRLEAAQPHGLRVVVELPKPRQLD